jgi:hypothetical protein
MTYGLVFAALVLLAVVATFVRICIRLKRGGGRLTTIGLGATYELMPQDRRKATATILNMNAGKKLEDQNIKESK